MWPFCSEMLFSACVLVSGIYLLYLICSQFKQKMNKTNKSPLALPFFLFFLIFDEVSGQWQISQNCNTNNKHVHAITTILSTRTSSFQFSWIVNSHRLYSPSISMLLSYFFFSSLLFSFAYSGHISQSTIPKNIVCHTILQWCVFFSLSHPNLIFAFSSSLFFWIDYYVVSWFSPAFFPNHVYI